MAGNESIISQQVNMEQPLNRGVDCVYAILLFLFLKYAVITLAFGYFFLVKIFEQRYRIFAACFKQITEIGQCYFVV
jgi:hypothetical protein